MAGQPDTLRLILRFGAVGSVGFVVDGGLLYTLISVGVDLYVARLVSFPIAALVTWWLNRNWTFSTAEKVRPAAQLGRYLTVQIIGALCNYAVYILTISSIEPTKPWAMAGFFLGSVVGMFVNYLGSRRFAFAGSKSARKLEPAPREQQPYSGDGVK
ncbi:GtrA family protein [Roseobacter litoralis]|uniref:GtrA family protein n=1 Tax=Roseobacter litoralis TaxID=42443 RepID=UPI002493E9A3|nr:GtrA family protein [Roseobacter litoralis]